LHDKFNFSCWIAFVGDLNAIPALAESWSTSSDGLVMTFKLNPKARFHNGDKITAFDVKESLTRTVSPESVVFNSHTGYAGVGVKKRSLYKGL